MRYNAYGEVARVGLPTGGAYEYTIKGYNGGDGVMTVAADSGYNIYRRVTERDELSDGTNVSSRMTYPVPSSGNLDPNHPSRSGTKVEVDITDPNNSQAPLARKEFHYFYGDPSSPASLTASPLAYPAWSDGLEFRTEIGDGTVTWQTQQNVWAQRACAQGEACWFNDPQLDTSPAHDPQMCQVNTTLDSGQTSAVVYQFDQYNNQTEKFEFDYGAAPPVGATCSASQSGASRVTNTAYNYSYVSPQNLLSLPSKVEIIGNEVLPEKWSYYLATFGYDESPLSAESSSIPGHDDQGKGAGNMSRGNLTSQSVWTDGSTASITRMTYDIAGNATSVMDPNNSAASPTSASLSGRTLWITSFLFYCIVQDSWAIHMAVAGNIVLRHGLWLAMLRRSLPLGPFVIAFLFALAFGVRAARKGRLQPHTRLFITAVGLALVLLLVWMESWFAAGFAQWSGQAYVPRPFVYRVLPWLAIAWPVFAIPLLQDRRPEPGERAG